MRKSKNDVISCIYGSQKSRSKRKNKPEPTYTKDEFSNWLLFQPKFHILYENWIENGCKSLDKPSVDRIDDNLGYSFDNIKLVTWKENLRKKRNNQGLLKRVSIVDENGKKIKSFASLTEASKETGIGISCISMVTNGVYKRAGGHLWKKD